MDDHLCSSVIFRNCLTGAQYDERPFCSSVFFSFLEEIGKLAVIDSGIAPASFSPARTATARLWMQLKQSEETWSNPRNPDLIIDYGKTAEWVKVLTLHSRDLWHETSRVYKLYTSIYYLCIYTYMPALHLSCNRHGYASPYEDEEEKRSGSIFSTFQITLKSWYFSRCQWNVCYPIENMKKLSMPVDLQWFQY